MVIMMWVRDVVQSVLLLLLMHMMRTAHSPLPLSRSFHLPLLALAIPIYPSFARLVPRASSKLRTPRNTRAHHVRMRTHPTRTRPHSTRHRRRATHAALLGCEVLLLLLHLVWMRMVLWLLMWVLPRITLITRLAVAVAPHRERLQCARCGRGHGSCNRSRWRGDGGRRWTTSTLLLIEQVTTTKKSRDRGTKLRHA